MGEKCRGIRSGLRGTHRHAPPGGGHRLLGKWGFNSFRRDIATSREGREREEKRQRINTGKQVITPSCNVKRDPRPRPFLRAEKSLATRSPDRIQFLPRSGKCVQYAIGGGSRYRVVCPLHGAFRILFFDAFGRHIPAGRQCRSGRQGSWYSRFLFSCRPWRRWEILRSTSRRNPPHNPIGATIPFRDKPRGDLLEYSLASSDPGACEHNGWYAAQHVYKSADESATEF